jgi:mono/diheme cytochrome c family protein
MKTRMMLFHGAFVAVLVAALFEGTAGQTTGPANRPMGLPSMEGGDLFRFYCASCHGRDGKGGGPVASTLKTAPTDLTTIASRNGGTFPRREIEALVTGDRDPHPLAHGSKDMPVWGPIFRALDAHDTLARIRIANIVGHLESIQRRR